MSFGAGLEARHSPAHNPRMTRSISIAGVSLELEEQGAARRCCSCTPARGCSRTAPGSICWRSITASSRRIIRAGASALPDWIARVDDLAYLYLDLAAELKLENAVLAGACFRRLDRCRNGRPQHPPLRRLVLADPLGIKVGGVLDRDIADMHGMSRDEFMRLAWADPAKGEIDYTKLPDTELAGIARGREALAVFGWKPYMHNPRLKRWLHRIDIPDAPHVGRAGRHRLAAYGEAWKAEIPGATMETIANAGHYPHWEQPEPFAAQRVALHRPAEETRRCAAGISPKWPITRRGSRASRAARCAGDFRTTTSIRRPARC